MEQPNHVDLCHQLHGLLPVSQPGIISVYRALKQRPKTVMVATRFDLPVTLDTKPGWILQEIYNLWPDLSSGAGRVFQLIPILPRSLSIVHRPSSDIAYLLVLSRSLEMKQRAHCLMQICWGDRKWTTATMLPTFCNWYTLREFLQPIVTSSTGVKMDVSINGDFLDESLVEVVDGSVVSVRLSEGFSMSLCNDLQEFLNRHVNLFHLPPNTTGDTDVGLKAFVPQGRTSACGYHFECHTVFTHWKSTLMATALKFHPGSLIKESHLFPANVCFECSQPLFDPTVRHFLVPHDLKVMADMKCALLAIYTHEGTSTAGFYCPAKVRRSYLLEIGNPSKEWVLYHNLNRVGLEVIQVEHGDYFVLFEKGPRKARSPSRYNKATLGLVSESSGNADQGPLLMPYTMSTPAGPGLFLPSPSTIISAGEQGTPSDDQAWSPTQLRMDDIPCASHSNKVRNYAEATPYQLQAELDDASVVSEDPKYGCDADCLYCGQPCVRSKFGHVFHQCSEHYRWWRMHKP